MVQRIITSIVWLAHLLFQILLIFSEYKVMLGEYLQNFMLFLFHTDQNWAHSVHATEKW